MTPYYADDLVTIYHGDCREWMPEADVLVTDPPYGIEWQQHGGGKTGKSRGMRRLAGIVGDSDTTARDLILKRWGDRPALVFGSFRSPFPENVCQVLIHKKAPDAGLVGSVTGFRTDAEPIFLLGDWPKRAAHSSCVLASTVGVQRQAQPHPHTKPLDVLIRLLRAAPDGVVLDPFMGSGTTLVAAKSLNRRAIGIEIEERYCEIAANRCRQEVLGLSA